jgi:Fur family ferric uptake transcriptional regulator
MRPYRSTLALHVQESPLSLPERLRAGGLRPTATRLSVLRAIEGMPDPVSVSDVFMHMLAEGTTLSIATIYRVLGDFEAAGLLMRAWVPGPAGVKTVYSIIYPRAGREDALVHRLLCRRCGHSVAFQDEALLARLRRFTGRNGADESPYCLIVETDDCHECRGKDRPASDAQAAEPSAAADQETAIGDRPGKIYAQR